MTDELTNPALAELEFLIGEWEMVLSNTSFLPDPSDEVRGRIEVRPIEAGTLLAIRQGVGVTAPPAATWLIGRDESQTLYTVLYADGRGVSRVYEMSLSDGRWQIWRNNSDFAQRFDAGVSTEKTEIEGRWEKCASGGSWEHDFTISYARL